MLKTPALSLKARGHPLLNIDGSRLCTLVNIGSIFYTSVQGTYFYQVIFGTKLEFFWEQKTPLGFTIHTERHQFHWDQSIMPNHSKGIQKDCLNVLCGLALDIYWLALEAAVYRGRRSYADSTFSPGAKVSQNFFFL